MSLRPSVAEILDQHITLELESIDRMYLNLYVPQLQHENGAARFFRFHRGQPFVSSALMATISRAFTAAVDAFIRQHQIPVVRFVKGQRKDDVALEHLARFHGEEGILFVGIAQEKCTVFRTQKRRNPITGKSYPWIVRGSVLVNCYYFYGVDRDFGPFFLKFCSYFPYPAKFCLNGHEYLKRQATRHGLAYEAPGQRHSRQPRPGAAAKDLSSALRGSHHGFSNRLLRRELALLLGCDLSLMTPGRMTYDLRRLRLHGLIARISGSHRYQVTDFGLRSALFFTRTYARLLRPGLAEVLASGLPADSRLSLRFHQLQLTMDEWVAKANLAA